MNCPKCGSEMAEGSAFCTKCGASLSQGVAGETNNPGMNQGGPNMNQGAPNMNQGGPNMNQGAPNMNQGGPQPGGMPYGGPNRQMNGGMAQQSYYDPKDHTAEYSQKDISDNKVMAMVPYLLGTIGVIIALLASRESPYTYFHVRQSLKITVCSALVGIISALLFWTVLVPIAGGICMVILIVVRIISFFQVCSGTAKEAAIIGSFNFLR